MKLFARLLFLMVAFLMVAATVATSEARSPRRTHRTLTVKGTRAEFLFNTMNEFENVKGLAGTADCAMGTCGTSMKEVTCTKIGDGDPLQTEPALFCTAMSTETQGLFVKITNRDPQSAAISSLRRAMIDAIGRQPSSATRNLIYADSIDCTARGINRELDQLDVESTFECKIKTY